MNEILSKNEEPIFMGQCERETWQVKTEGGKRLPQKKCS